MLTQIKLMQYKYNNKSITAGLQKVEMTLKRGNNFLPFNTWRTAPLELVCRRGSWEVGEINPCKTCGYGGAAKNGLCLSYDVQ